MSRSLFFHQYPALAALSFAVACTPSVKQAGHTITPEEPHRENVVAPTKKTTTHNQELAAQTTPARVPAPEREPLYAEVPEGGRLVGSAGPIALEGWGKGGHWIAYCSLSAGTKVDTRGTPDRPANLHLTVGEKDEDVEALLANDEQGRFLVVLTGEKAVLIDAVRDQRLDLSSLNPDLRFDELPSHRSFAFTDAGLVILSGDTGNSGFFLPLSDTTDFEKSLEDWAHPIDFGARPVWRVEGHGRSFAGITVPEGGTEKSWPVSATQTPTRRCSSPSEAFPSFERVSAYRPDRNLSAVWAEAPVNPKKNTKLETAEAPGFVFGFQGGWVRREDSGRLLFVRGKTQEQITSERCGARILHADAKTGLFLVACEEYTPVPPKIVPAKNRPKPKYRFDMYLIRPGFVRSLKVDTMRTGIDHRGPRDQRFVPIRPGATAALVDFKKRKLVLLDGELQVLLSGPSGAVLRRGNTLRLWTERGEENVDLKFDTLDAVLTKGRAASIGKTMLRLDDELATWDLPAEPLAITEQGYALVPKKAPQMGAWPAGPLLLLGPPLAEESDTPPPQK